LACASPGSPLNEALAVQYASEDESLCSDSEDGIALEEVYSFDRERVAQLVQRGACLEELTEAIWMDMAGSLERFLTSEQILNMSASGDGSMANVGIKVGGAFPCPLCNQRFDSKQQRQIHSRFMHACQDVDTQQEALLEQAVACARRKHRRSIVRAVKHAEVCADSEETSEPSRFVTKRRKSSQRNDLQEEHRLWHGKSVTLSELRSELFASWGGETEGEERLQAKWNSLEKVDSHEVQSRPALLDVDSRIQQAVAAAMSRREVSSVLPAALMGVESTAQRRRRRASIG